MASEAALQMAFLRVLKISSWKYIGDIARATGRSRKALYVAAAKLIARGLVEKHADEFSYRLTKAGVAFLMGGLAISNGGPRGKHTGHRKVSARTIRARVWDALRLPTRTDFTVPEIVELAGADANAGNVQPYLKLLARGGYLRELPLRQQGNDPNSRGFKRWRLAMDTGPEAPRVSGDKKSIYDPNTDEIVELA